MIDEKITVIRKVVVFVRDRSRVRVGRSVVRRTSSPVLAGVLCALAAGSVVAEPSPAPTIAAPPRVSDTVLHRPSAMPDRIVLSWVGDATTNRAVTWRTSTDVTRAYAEIAPAEGGFGFVKQKRRVDAVTQPFTSASYRCHLHVVEFRDLKPGTPYVYRVGDGVNFSEWFQFRTAAASPEPFCFIYLGDAQNELRSLWSRVIREAWSNAPKAAFMLHVGDLVNNAESDAQWGEWFGAGGWLNGMIPVVATPGNHEYVSEKKPDGSKTYRLSRHWRAQFTFPTNGPPGLEETVYYLDYQNLRVISLNSNERQEEQIPWLEQVLSKNDRTWTAILFHHPIFSVAKGRDSGPLRNAWKPVFDRHHVDLVLNGHDHVYGRTGLVGSETHVATGTTRRSAPAGTVYVVSVSGPKMYDLTPEPPSVLRRVAEDTQLYQIISIDGPVLHYEARTATGDLYDAFTLKKQSGAPNEMVEQVPNVPERRRKPIE